jgi:hypothetical protein
MKSKYDLREGLASPWRPKAGDILSFQDASIRRVFICNGCGRVAFVPWPLDLKCHVLFCKDCGQVWLARKENP